MSLIKELGVSSKRNRKRVAAEKYAEEVSTYQNTLDRMQSRIEAHMKEAADYGKNSTAVSVLQLHKKVRPDWRNKWCRELEALFTVQGFEFVWQNHRVLISWPEPSSESE